MNIVLLSGNLGKNPEPINGGLKFSLATTDYDGKEKFTLWTDILVFGRKAENLQGYLSKGRQVLVRGYLRDNPDAEGKLRKSVVLANEIELI